MPRRERGSLVDLDPSARRSQGQSTAARAARRRRPPSPPSRGIPRPRPPPLPGLAQPGRAAKTTTAPPSPICHTDVASHPRPLRAPAAAASASRGGRGRGRPFPTRQRSRPSLARGGPRVPPPLLPAAAAGAAIVVAAATAAAAAVLSPLPQPLPATNAPPPPAGGRGDFVAAPTGGWAAACTPFHPLSFLPCSLFFDFCVCFFGSPLVVVTSLLPPTGTISRVGSPPPFPLWNPLLVPHAPHPPCTRSCLRS